MPAAIATTPLVATVWKTASLTSPPFGLPPAASTQPARPLLKELDQRARGRRMLAVEGDDLPHHVHVSRAFAIGMATRQHGNLTAVSPRPGRHTIWPPGAVTVHLGWRTRFC
jgi:hypothetical protein